MSESLEAGLGPEVRYVTDVPYAAVFTPDLAPAWLDFVALVNGLRPPARREGFAWCDLGCGHGVTATILAATHGQGVFHGVDIMPGHIEAARRSAEAAGVGNLFFHAMDFDQAAAADLPAFDYIVAHGVYSWVDEEVKASLRRFVERRLKPGGLLYLCYNAMPGFAYDLPFQQLAFALAGAESGDSSARFDLALARIEALHAAGSPVLKASPMADGGIRELQDKAPRAYFAHEYLCPAWRPLAVTEVRADLAPLGLEPAGSTIIVSNFDSYELRARARAALDEIEDPDLRALARDYFLITRFRRDVFARGAESLEPEERRARLLDAVFLLERPASLVEYEMETEAGKLRFDNPAARAIVAALAEGPRRLRDCAGGEIEEGDLLASAMALASARTIRPVERACGEGGQSDLAPLRHVLAAATAEERDTQLVPLPCGTALWIDPDALDPAKAEAAEASEALKAWAAFAQRQAGA